MKVKVDLESAENLDVRVKQKTDSEGNISTVTVVKFECATSPVRLARVIDMMKAGVPCYATIGSHQALADPFRRDGPLGEKEETVEEAPNPLVEEAEREEEEAEEETETPSEEDLGLADDLLQGELEEEEEAVESTSK